MSSTLALWMLSAICALGALWTFVKERRAAQWPSTLARVVKRDPKYDLERTGNTFVFNLDADYFLEWTVDGREYQRKLDDEASVTLSGFKLWRRPPLTGPYQLHYNPENASEHVLTEEFGSWKVLVGVASVATVSALLASIV